MEQKGRVRFTIESEGAFSTKPIFTEYIGARGVILDEALIRNIENILDTYSSNSISGDEIKTVLEKLVQAYRNGLGVYRDTNYNIGYIKNKDGEMELNFDLKVGFSRVRIDKQPIQFQYTKDGCMVLE